MKEKIGRIRFSGRGFFSSINIFTTRFAMIDAIEVYGLGGDGLRGKNNRREDDIRDSLQAPPLYQEEKL